jgi:hypothetical protein
LVAFNCCRILHLSLGKIDSERRALEKLTLHRNAAVGFW